MTHFPLLLLLSSVCLTSGCTTPPPPVEVDLPPSPECSDMPVTLNFAGLFTDPNQLNLPPGAARQALNVVSDRPGVAECRPGQEPLSGAFTTASERLRSGFAYGGYNFEHTGSALYRRTVSTGAVVKVADNVPASGSNGRMRFTVAGDDLYMATSDGVVVMDGATGTPTLAGIPRMPDLFYTPNSTITTGSTWLPAGSSVAYRSVLGRNDADGRVALGAPSSRSVYTNVLASPAALQFYVPLPDGAKAGDFLQVYRSSDLEAGADPGDILGLVYEAPLTSADVTARYVLITDRTPSVLIGASLYSNALQEGITMANDRPGMALDVAHYKGHVFLANTTQPHRMLVRLIGIMDPGTSITIAGATISLGPEAPAGTVSQQVEQQAREIVGQANAYVSGIVAYYVSSQNDPPGMMVFERTTPTGAAFTIQSSAGGALVEPVITTAYSSTQDRRPNGIDISKAGLPYAFPSNSAYHLRLGAASEPILRIIPNRDSLFVFKTDGIWRIYEAGGSFGTHQISTDVHLTHPDAIAVMDNQVLALTNQGIAAVSETGIEFVDAPVHNIVESINNTLTPPTLAPSTAPGFFAVADPQRLRYFLWHASDTATTTSVKALVYNGQTDTWTERGDSTTGGYIGADGLLYLGSPDSNTVTRQRNTGTASDYKDPGDSSILFWLEWAKLHNGTPHRDTQYTELNLLLEEPTTGPYVFTFQNHYNRSREVTGKGNGSTTVRVWVPNGMQRTSRLAVGVKREVLDEYLAVLGIADLAHSYNGPTSKA